MIELLSNSLVDDVAVYRDIEGAPNGAIVAFGYTPANGKLTEAIIGMKAVGDDYQVIIGLSAPYVGEFFGNKEYSGPVVDVSKQIDLVIDIEPASMNGEGSFVGAIVAARSAGQRDPGTKSSIWMCLGTASGNQHLCISSDPVERGLIVPSTPGDRCLLGKLKLQRKKAAVNSAP